MPERANETGNTYGRLTVTGFDERREVNGRYRYYWACRCSCGTEKSIEISNLRRGSTVSCGCNRRDKASNRKPANTLPEGESSMRALLRLYQDGAKRRDLSFELTEEEFRTLTSSNCHYCGAEPSNELDIKTCNGSYIYSGIDRKDNTIGYTTENCVPCCKTCNLGKHEMSYEEYIQWLKAMVNYRNSLSKTEV